MDINRKRKIFLIALIALLALFSRLWQFGLIPGDINQDEAFAGYEAWAIMHFGVDSSLHPYPVYLTAWGSGMNALESYLCMPFIALFGLKTWVIRLPQLITGLLSVAAAYAVGKEAAGERGGLLFAFLLAICPWHILLCRWGLESNLAPGFLLFGMYFFLRGLADGKYLPLSALMYGLALYTYATIWSVLPFIILMMLVYAAAVKRLRADRWLLLSFVILALLALPLLLFLLVNYGVIDEIALSWISIPKMLVMRKGEISLSHIGENLKNMLGILKSRSDGLPWNSPETFGALYGISLLFIAVGLGRAVVRALRARAGAAEWLMLIQLAGAVVLCALVSVNLNRMNIMLMPLVFFEAEGVQLVFSRIGKTAGLVLCAAYLLLFSAFEAYYFTDYARRVSVDFSAGLEEAFTRALSMEGDIYLSRDVHYPKILFYSKTPPEEFNATVEYNYYPAAYLSARSFGRFHFDPDEGSPDKDCIYVLRKGCTLSEFEREGFMLEQHGDYFLIYYQ